ncbi:MAG: amidohydrolase family protein [Thermohalobaculum sp.]|nr:amidohydrolase family protein [Thermohalobaculum sp.]
MIDRRLSGRKPALALPPGTVDTQMHMYLPGFPALPGGPDLPEGLPGAAEYRRVMAWIGIDRVVITQGNAHQHDNGNLLACLAAMGPGIARGVAVITGDTPEADLDRLHTAGVRGARIMDLPGGAVGLAGLEAVDARTAARGWVLAVQFDGSHIGAHEARLAALKSRYIIDHHGKIFAGATPSSPQVATIKRLIERGNCWFKFAGCYEASTVGGPDYPDIAAVARDIAAFAPERIVWGTNWPHNQAKTTRDYPDDADLTDTVLGWIGDEARRKLALVDTPAALFDFAPRVLHG